jgi:hypothetical protein
MAENDDGAFALIEIGDIDAADGEVLHVAPVPAPTRIVMPGSSPAMTSCIG